MTESDAGTALAEALHALPVTPAANRTRWMWRQLLAASGAAAPVDSDLRAQYTPDSLADMPPEQVADFFVQFGAVAARVTAVRIEASRPNVVIAVLVTTDGEAIRFRCAVEEAAPHRIIGHLSSPTLSAPALEPSAYVDRMVERNGRSVQVRDFGGDGPLLLLWHGSGCDLSIWEPMVSHLERFRVIAQDMPGHGRSPLHRFTVPDAMADTDALLAELEVNEPILVGHSLGGRTALHYAAGRPCRGLVCLDGPNTVAAADRFELQSDLRSVGCPTMIVLCTEPEGPDAATWTTRRGILSEYATTHHPGIRIEWMPTGHMLILTMAEQTAALITQFTSASIHGAGEGPDDEAS